jgi:hypothetical protein
MVSKSLKSPSPVAALSGHRLLYEPSCPSTINSLREFSFPFYPPSQKTMDVSPWMNAQGGLSETRRAKEGASADCAEEMKDTTGVSPWRLH